MIELFLVFSNSIKEFEVVGQKMMVVWVVP